MAALTALGGIGGPKARAAVRPWLAPPAGDNRGWWIRLAADALARIGDPADVGPIAALLASEEDELARYGAVEALARFDTAAARAAVDRCVDDRDPLVAEVAREAVGARR